MASLTPSPDDSSKQLTVNIYDGTSREIPLPVGESINIIPVTDIEGRQKFLTNYFRDGINTGLKLFDKDGNAILWSKDLQLTGEERIEIPKGSVLVFNGDLFDHGPDDLKLAQIFANTAKLLENDAPERLQIIIGNRDSNKLRFAWELNATSIEARIVHNDTPTWPGAVNQLRFAEHLIDLMFDEKASEDLIIKFTDDQTKTVSKIKEAINKLIAADIKKADETDAQQRQRIIKQYVREGEGKDPAIRSKIFAIAQNNMTVETANPAKPLGDAKDKQNCLKLVYLKWMLKNTMACGVEASFGNRSTFQHRSAELQETTGSNPTQLGVLKSFEDAIKENGAYRQILDRGKIAVRIQDRLFIHGGLTENSTIVNGVEYADKGVGLDAWIAAINEDFKKSRDAVTVHGDILDRTLPGVSNSVIRGGLDGGNGGITEALQSHDMDKAKKNELIAGDKTGSTVTQLFADDPNTKTKVPTVPQKIIDFLTKAGIKQVVLGHQPIGNSPIGTAFTIGGIEFVYIDITRAKNQEEATAVHKITYQNLNGEMQTTASTSAFLSDEHPLLVLDHTYAYVNFKKDFPIPGLLAGTNTMRHTADGGVVFGGTQGFESTVKYYSAEDLKTQASALLQAMENPPQEIANHLEIIAGIPGLYLKELYQIQTPHINTDRAYYLIHNLRFLLKDKQAESEKLTPKEEKLIKECIEAIKTYRAETNTNFKAHIDSIEDGDLDLFFTKIESKDGKQLKIANKVQELNQELWRMMVAREQELDKTRPEADKVGQPYDSSVGLIAVDVQNDFSKDAPGGGRLGVTFTKHIANLRKQMFRIIDGKKVVDTRDMHLHHTCSSICGHGSPWDNDRRWKLLDGSWFPKDGPLDPPLQVGQSFPPEVLQDYPQAGDYFWGSEGHCERNTHASDHVDDLPIPPDAKHVIKGITPKIHQYGGCNVNRFNVANYLKKLGVKVALMTGWATNYCVGESGREVIQSKDSVSIVVPQDCVGGVEYGEPDINTNPATIRKQFVDSNRLQETAGRMGIEYDAANDAKFAAMVEVVPAGQNVRKVIETAIAKVSSDVVPKKPSIENMWVRPRLFSNRTPPSVTPPVSSPACELSPIPAEPPQNVAPSGAATSAESPSAAGGSQPPTSPEKKIGDIIGEIFNKLHTDNTTANITVNQDFPRHLHTLLKHDAISKKDMPLVAVNTNVTNEAIEKITVYDAQDVDAQKALQEIQKATPDQKYIVDTCDSVETANKLIEIYGVKNLEFKQSYDNIPDFKEKLNNTEAVFQDLSHKHNLG